VVVVGGFGWIPRVAHDLTAIVDVQRGDTGIDVRNVDHGQNTPGVEEAMDTGSVAKDWTPLQPDKTTALWTDDYSNILGIMLRKKFGL